MSLIFFRGLSLGCILSLVVVACSNDVDTDGEEAGATSGGGDGASGSGAASGQGASGGGPSSSASGGGIGGAPGDCANVPQYIDNLYQAASACAPADPSLHCQDVVEGFCCPVLVESINSPETQAYLDFLDLTRDQCPEMWERCQTVKCAPPPVGTCVPDDSPAGGHCMPMQ